MIDTWFYVMILNKNKYDAIYAFRIDTFLQNIHFSFSWKDVRIINMKIFFWHKITIIYITSNYQKLKPHIGLSQIRYFSI